MKGLQRDTPVSERSSTFRVTRVNPCTISIRLTTLTKHAAAETPDCHFATLGWQRFLFRNSESTLVSSK